MAPGFCPVLWFRSRKLREQGSGKRLVPAVSSGGFIKNRNYLLPGTSIILPQYSYPIFNKFMRNIQRKSHAKEA